MGHIVSANGRLDSGVCGSSQSIIFPACLRNFHEAGGCASSLPEPFGGLALRFFVGQADILEEMAIEFGQIAEGMPLSTARDPGAKDA